MKDVCAFVVGVARYDIGWTAEGAARNAYAVTRLLLAGGVPAERINGFIDADALTGRQRAALARRGIRLRAPTAGNISAFWRTDLPKLLGHQDKVFAYWSGHGMADENFGRIFFCRGYTDAQIDEVFDATQFLAYLRSAGYNQADRQLFIADACGTYSNSRVATKDDRPPASSMGEVDQLSIYATADGAYADVDEYGLFTQMLFGVLRRFRRKWPDSDTFLEALKPKLREATQRPFWIRYAGKHQQEAQDQLVGRANGYVSAITRLLAPFALAGDILKRPYRQTVRSLRVEPPLASHELPRLVDALTAIPDARADGAPLALLQFLTRLSRDPKLEPAAKAAVEGWLAQNATPQVRAEIDQALAGEIRRVTLLIDIANDRHGAATVAEAQLLEPDGWPVAGFAPNQHQVASDDGLLDWIVEQLQCALELDEKARPELHLLIDPPLFHLPFHKALLDQIALGQLFDCIVHFRLRARGSIRAQPERWEAWAKALRGAPLDTLALLRIAPQPTPFPAGEGICFTDFVHGPLARSPQQVQQLTLLLLRGAPYLCWPVGDAGMARGDVDAALRAMIDTANDFDTIPERIRARRLDGCAFANELAVLWDDPERRPLPPAAGVGR